METTQQPVKKKIDGLSITKMIVGTIATAGVGAVVAGVIKTNVPASNRFIQKMSITVGGLVISALISNAATTFIDGKIDTFAATFKKLLADANAAAQQEAQKEEEAK